VAIIYKAVRDLENRVGKENAALKAKGENGHCAGFRQTQPIRWSDGSYCRMCSLSHYKAEGTVNRANAFAVMLSMLVTCLWPTLLKLLAQ
jgi:hypothetical protein